MSFRTFFFNWGFLRDVRDAVPPKRKCIHRTPFREVTFLITHYELIFNKHKNTLRLEGVLLI